ncbi:MAG: tetratricopeptide repeat protein [bacterium]|nr:tetratricopeptide repeat protein [bacterium]
MDNFEKNLERADKTGTEFILRSDTVEIVGVLLEHVNFGPNATRLIITSRYNFSLDKGAGDLVKKRLASVYMSGLYRSDQYRLARRLVDSTHTGGDSSLDWLTEQGRGNPRLMELLAGLLQEQSVSGNRGADGHERDSWSMENDPKMQGLTASASVAREDFVRDSGLADLLLHTSIRDQLLPLLRNLSVFRCPVPVKDFEELANAFGLNDWKKPLDMAIDLGMIEYNRFDGTYFLTPLLREVCSQEAVEGGKDAGVEMDGSPSTVRLHTIAYRYYHALSSSRKEETELGEECIYHALRCGKIRSVSQIGAVLVRRLRDELRQPRDARTKGEWILSGLMKKTGFPTFYDVDLLNETALTFKYQGKYKKAQEYYQMVAGIADISLDSRAGNRNNLGAIYLELGEYSKAEALFKENEDVVKTLYGEQSMALAFTLNNLGTARAHLKKYDEAAGLHKRALKILRKNRPAYSREIAGTYNNLGYVAAQKGNWERALEYYWQAYIINKKLHYTAHPDMAANLGNMASVIMKQAHAAGKKGKQDGSDVGGQDKKSLYFKAKEFCRHALQISRRTYGNMHLSTAIILSTLGDVCFQLKETEEAKKHYHGSRDIFRELAPNHLLLKKLDKKLLLNSETKILPPELEDIEMSLEVDAHPGVVSQDETFLDELRKVIEKNLSDMDFDIPKLCETLFLSRSTLNRRVKQITGETIGHYLRDYRLERGAHLLKNNNGNVTEVSVAVGFTDPYYFARSFKKKFGITPKAFQMGYLKKNAGTKSDS